MIIGKIRTVTVVATCLISSLVYSQNIPELTQDETAKYVLMLSGIDVGDVCFSDSVFTKIGDAMIHVRESSDYCNFWYHKYAKDYLIDHYGKDSADNPVFDIIRPFIFENYQEAKLRYTKFVEKRIKGIQQYSRYKTSVEQLLSKASSAGGIEKFFLLSAYNSPVYFTAFKKSLTPYLYVISSSLMNIKKPQEVRLAHILREEVVPVLSCFSGTFDKTIKYYGLTYTFVSDNLTGEDFNAQGEAISVIAPAESVAKYKSLAITQEELLKTCELFYVNSRSKEVRKITYDSLK